MYWASCTKLSNLNTTHLALKFDYLITDNYCVIQLFNKFDNLLLIIEISLDSLVQNYIPRGYQILVFENKNIIHLIVRLQDLLIIVVGFYKVGCSTTVAINTGAWLKQ